jgi:hypothetical protein
VHSRFLEGFLNRRGCISSEVLVDKIESDVKGGMMIPSSLAGTVTRSRRGHNNDGAAPTP